MKTYRNLIIALLFVCCCSIDVNAQIINNFAGSGTSLGDGGPATNAQVTLPGCGSFDGAGNYYFGQPWRIRKVTTSGIITTVAGGSTAGYGGDGGPATSALIHPQWIDVDSVGNIYIADYVNYRLRKVDAATGIIHAIAGNGTPTHTGDNGPATAATITPSCICIDKHGNIYIEDSARIRKIDTSGIITTIAGTGTGGFSGDGGPATAAQIIATLDMTVDNSGNLYFGANGGVRIRKIDMSTGIITTIAGTGVYLYNGDEIPATAAQFKEYGIAFDANNNLFIADLGNQRIRMIDNAGIIHTIAGTGIAGYSGDGGLATVAKIYNPEGVAIDACGNVYIADEANNRIRKITYPSTPITLTNYITTLIPTICAGAPATFAAASSTSSGATTYQWYVNGMSIAGATTSSYTYSPADADSIRCIATATNTCTSAVTSSNTIIMSVIAIITPSVTVATPATAPVGSVVTVNATVAGAGTGYTLHWYNNAVLFATTAAPTTTYTKLPGTDHITATVVPGEGCYDSTTSAASTVNELTTNISNAGLPQIDIYPNPVKNALYVANVTTEAKYKILSTVGDVLLQGVLEQGNNSIDVKELPNGIYMLRIYSPGQQFLNFQILKSSY